MATSKPFVSTSFSYETLEETLDIKPKGSIMHIGIPKETSFNENRIALTPEAVGVIVANGHHVSVETNAGIGSNYTDKDYSEAGAKIVFDKKAIFECQVIVKSAPVSESDCELLKPDTLIISPIHLAVMKKHILEKMMEKKVTALSFENLKDDSGHNPIVRSMSEIAGSAVMLIAGQYLSNANNGKGVLVGGISGIPPTKVIIIGAGIVGEYAARTALAMGASVKIFDNSIYRLKRLQNNIGVRLWTSVIEPKILAKQLKTCDVAVGALSGDGGSRLGLLVGLGASDARWTFSVGLLGGYTSFSAISVFSERLWMEGRRATALAQALLPVLAAIPGVRCGAALVAWLAPGGAA